MNNLPTSALPSIDKYVVFPVGCAIHILVSIMWSLVAQVALYRKVVGELSIVEFIRLLNTFYLDFNFNVSLD